MNRQLPPIPVWKRLTDIVGSLFALFVLSPVMILAAVLVKLSSPGPVFYRAQRAGYKGQPFNELKFRTMHIGADRHGAFTLQNDCRIFPVGKILRLFKIDELPQILNILRGEMSIVGPRPEDLTIVQRYYDARQRQVLEVAPGLTGFPQVRFFPELCIIDPEGMDPQQHYCTVILPVRLEMDLEYVSRQSFWLDIYLIAMTVYLIAVRPCSILLFGMKKVNLPAPGYSAVSHNANS